MRTAASMGAAAKAWKLLTWRLLAWELLTWELLLKHGSC